jgi:hypothetical protein
MLALLFNQTPAGTQTYTETPQDVAITSDGWVSTILILVVKADAATSEDQVQHVANCPVAIPDVGTTTDSLQVGRLLVHQVSDVLPASIQMQHLVQMVSGVVDTIQLQDTSVGGYSILHEVADTASSSDITSSGKLLIHDHQDAASTSHQMTDGLQLGESIVVNLMHQDSTTNQWLGLISVTDLLIASDAVQHVASMSQFCQSSVGATSSVNDGMLMQHDVSTSLHLTDQISPLFSRVEMIQDLASLEQNVLSHQLMTHQLTDESMFVPDVGHSAFDRETIVDDCLAQDLAEGGIGYQHLVQDLWVINDKTQMINFFMRYHEEPLTLMMHQDVGRAGIMRAERVDDTSLSDDRQRALISSLQSWKIVIHGNYIYYFPSTPKGTICAATISQGKIQGWFDTHMSMPGSSANYSIVGLGDYLYLATLAPDGTGNSMYRARVAGDGKLGPWIETKSLPVERAHPILVVSDANLFLIEGPNFQNDGENRVYCASLMSNGDVAQWLECGSIQTQAKSRYLVSVR